MQIQQQQNLSSYGIAFIYLRITDLRTHTHTHIAPHESIHASLGNIWRVYGFLFFIIITITTANRNGMFVYN